MADGIRILQGGQGRGTQSGARRITERAVMAGAALAAAGAMPAAAGRRRRTVSVALGAGTHATSTARGKTVAGAQMQAAATLAAVPLAARRRAGAGLTAVPLLGVYLGRNRPACTYLTATAQASMQPTRTRPAHTAMFTGATVKATVIKTAPAQGALATTPALEAVALWRKRSVQLAFATTADMAATNTPKLAPVATSLYAQAQATFGREQDSHYRLLEDGTWRITQGANRRVLDDGNTWGNIVRKQPPYRVYVKHFGVWTVIAPYARHGGQWQLPKHIHTRMDGQWRLVRSHL